MPNNHNDYKSFTAVTLRRNTKHIQGISRTKEASIHRLEDSAHNVSCSKWCYRFITNALGEILGTAIWLMYYCSNKNLNERKLANMSEMNVKMLILKLKYLFVTK